jgi:hypothetical protein
MRTSSGWVHILFARNLFSPFLGLPVTITWKLSHLPALVALYLVGSAHLLLSNHAINVVHCTVPVVTRLLLLGGVHAVRRPDTGVRRIPHLQ